MATAAMAILVIYLLHLSTAAEPTGNPDESNSERGGSSDSDAESFKTARTSQLGTYEPLGGTRFHETGLLHTDHRDRLGSSEEFQPAQRGFMADLGEQLFPSSIPLPHKEETGNNNHQPSYGKCNEAFFRKEPVAEEDTKALKKLKDNDPCKSENKHHPEGQPEAGKSEEGHKNHLCKDLCTKLADRANKVLHKTECSFLKLNFDGGECLPPGVHVSKKCHCTGTNGSKSTDYETAALKTACAFGTGKCGLLLTPDGELRTDKPAGHRHDQRGRDQHDHLDHVPEHLKAAVSDGRAQHQRDDAQRNRERGRRV